MLSQGCWFPEVSLKCFYWWMVGTIVLCGKQLSKCSWRKAQLWTLSYGLTLMASFTYKARTQSWWFSLTCFVRRHTLQSDFVEHKSNFCRSFYFYQRRHTLFIIVLFNISIYKFTALNKSMISNQQAHQGGWSNRKLFTDQMMDEKICHFQDLLGLCLK